MSEDEESELFEGLGMDRRRMLKRMLMGGAAVYAAPVITSFGLDAAAAHRPPHGGNQPRPPHGGNQPRPPHGGNQPCPPHGGNMGHGHPRPRRRRWGWRR